MENVIHSIETPLILLLNWVLKTVNFSISFF